MDEFTLRHGDETRQELLCAGAGLFEDNKRLRRRVAELEQMLQEEQQMLQQVPVAEIRVLLDDDVTVEDFLSAERVVDEWLATMAQAQAQ